MADKKTNKLLETDTFSELVVAERAIQARNSRNIPGYIDQYDENAVRKSFEGDDLIVNPETKDTQFFTFDEYITNKYDRQLEYNILTKKYEFMTFDEIKKRTLDGEYQLDPNTNQYNYVEFDKEKKKSFEQQKEIFEAKIEKLKELKNEFKDTELKEAKQQKLIFEKDPTTYIRLLKIKDAAEEEDASYASMGINRDGRSAKQKYKDSKWHEFTNKRAKEDKEEEPNKKGTKYSITEKNGKLALQVTLAMHPSFLNFDIEDGTIMINDTSLTIEQIRNLKHWLMSRGFTKFSLPEGIPEETQKGFEQVAKEQKDLEEEDMIGTGNIKRPLIIQDTETVRLEILMKWIFLKYSVHRMKILYSSKKTLITFSKKIIPIRELPLPLNGLLKTCLKMPTPNV